MAKERGICRTTSRYVFCTKSNNAQKACLDVIAQYQKPANVLSLDLNKVIFDQGLQEVTITTSMT